MLALLLVILTLLGPPSVRAIYDPLSVPNNRYGIHIVDNNDMTELPALVNSSGGSWGYVTMVLSDSDRDPGKWQSIFDAMRRLHLIPIIRLATHVENGAWVKPQKDRLYEIVNLLNNLQWPTENRYVILYNEPNHANEWGGTLDPEGYAEILVYLAQALKSADQDFFVLPAGLDASSASDGRSMDAAQYLSRMIAAKPEIFTLLDGWSSHSYPNPGFSGSPYARGRGTLSTFDWELGYLQAMGLTKNLPVFITETGWEHSEGKSYIPGLLSPDQVGANIQVAAGSVWADPRIAAITPFIYNYQDVPFDHFSWRRLGNNGHYSHYSAYQSIPKTKGAPKQHESYALLSDILPSKLVSGSAYSLSALVENTGQGIIDPADGYTLEIASGAKELDTFINPLPIVEPRETGQIMVHIKTPDEPGQLSLSITLVHNGKEFLLQTRSVDLVPPPSVTVNAHLGWRRSSDASGVTIIIYDKDTVLQKFTGLTMKNGDVQADRLMNIIPGLPYRVVILVPGYLPRQVIGALNATNTVIYPNRFLPLDFNGDGAFSAEDLSPLIWQSPWTAVLKFFGP